MKRTHGRLLALAFWTCVGLGGGSIHSARAQTRPGPALEVSTGWTGFVDETLVGHGVVGGAARFYLTPRLSVGPQLTYMIGPRTDRDLLVTGNLTFDFLTDRPGRFRVIPYVTGGGGLFQHSERFVSGTFTSNEWGGAGRRRRAHPVRALVLRGSGIRDRLGAPHARRRDDRLPAWPGAARLALTIPGAA